MAHITRLTVRFYELDPYDHVNHAVYFNYFEAARIEALAEVGYDLTRLKAEGFHLVVSEASAKFRKPAEYGDQLEITTTLVELRRASSRWSQIATSSGELIATVEILGAITDPQGRPRRAPEAFQTAIGSLR